MTLKIMPAAGGGPRELLRVGIRFGGGLTWTPDGREILFAKSPKSVEKPTVELWRISADGGEPRRLELAAEGLRGLRFHPDGQRIVFSAGQPKAEVWVMENFLPELAAK